MGLIERIAASRAESRVIGGVPWRPWDSPYMRFNIGGPVHPSRSFYGVDEGLGLPALYSGARLLADSVASLPVKIYTRASNDGSPVRWRGPSIFDQPSVTGTTFDWLFTAMTSLVLQGNAWGFITGTDGYGFPTGIEWIPPDDVTVVDDEMQPWNPLRARVYVYGRLMENWRTELFHVKAFSLAGRVEGISLLRAHALTILSGIEAQKFGTDWFRSGGFPPGTFQNSEVEIDQDQAEEIRASLTATIRRHEPLVYGRDWDYKPVTVPPSEAQFIEAIRMTAGQVAAVLGLPAERIGGTRGDSLTYSNVEQSTLQIIEALRPWLVRLENAFYRLLPSNRYVRFDTDALLKTDLETRTKIYAQQRAMGLRTIDELRDLEDLPPLKGKAGGEIIPLDVMVAMSRSIKGIPTSMLEQITLEMDLAVDRLQKLESQGLAADSGMPAPGPESYLDRVVSAQRGNERVSGADLRDVRDIAEAFGRLGIALPDHAVQDLAREYGRFAPGKHLRGSGQWGPLGGRRHEPEFVGAWIPPQRELVLNGVNGSNVNGSDH